MSDSAACGRSRTRGDSAVKRPRARWAGRLPVGRARLRQQAPARTLGWWLGGPVLGSLACWVMAVALATLMGAGPFTAMTASAAAAALLAYLAAYTLSTLLTAIFTTVMHVDQRRRQG